VCHKAKKWIAEISEVAQHRKQRRVHFPQCAGASGRLAFACVSRKTGWQVELGGNRSVRAGSQSLVVGSLQARHRASRPMSLAAHPVSRRALLSRRGCSKISDRLRRVLQWWQKFLLAAPVRIIRMTDPPRERVVVFSDATGAGDLAYVIIFPAGRCEFRAFTTSMRKHECARRRIFASCRGPGPLKRWLKRRKTQAGCEACARSLS
jgi:hypothetical protein